MITTSRRDLLGAAALVIATLLAYWPTLQNGFVWDDDLWLTHNEAVQAPGGLGDIWRLDLDAQSGHLHSATTQYYPLVFTSFWLEHRLWGLAPAGYHLVNVLLHLANALLVWRLARRLGIPGAWLIGAILALHPVHVESVAWVTQRRNVLSGLFYLLAALAYLRFDETGRWRHYLAAGALLVCALLSKTVTATLPLALVVMVIRQRRLRSRPGFGRRDALRLLPLLALGVAAGLVTANLEQGEAGAAGLLLGAGPLTRLLVVAPSAFWFYAGKILWPWPVTFVYPQWHIDAGQPLWYLPLLGVVLAGAAAVWAWRRHGLSGPGLALLYAAVTLAPALGVFRVFYFRYAYVADHWQYLGSLGFIALAVGGVAAAGRRWLRPGRRRRAGLVAAVCALAVCGFFAHRQTTAYASAETLWRDTLRKNPDAWLALNNIGRIEAQQALALHDTQRRSRLLNQAREHFERAMTYPAARPEACNNLANIAYLRRDYVEAARLYQQAIQLQPADPGPYANLRQVLTTSGHTSQAVVYFERALQTEPDLPNLTRAEILHQLAIAQADLGKLDKAAASACRALATYPDLPNTRVLYAQLLCGLERHHEALSQLQAVTADSREYVTAQTMLIDLLATCPDESLRDCAAARSRLAELREIYRGRELPVEIFEISAKVAAQCSGTVATGAHGGEKDEDAGSS